MGKSLREKTESSYPTAASQPVQQAECEHPEVLLRPELTMRVDAVVCLRDDVGHPAVRPFHAAQTHDDRRRELSILALIGRRLLVVVHRAQTAFVRREGAPAV